MQVFLIDDITFVSGEHAFHYYKYNLLSAESSDESRKNELALYSSNFSGNDPIFKSASDAKKAGGRKGKSLNDDEIVRWNSLSMNVQYNICMSRLNYSKELLKILESTECKYLLHQENRGKSPIWGGRIDKKSGKLIGQNKLGIVWMEVRDEIKKTVCKD